MHRRDISRAKDTSSGNESAVHRKDEYRRQAEQMNKEKIKSDHRSSIQSKKPSEVDQESTSSSKDSISYRNGILELAKQRQQAYYQKDRSLTPSANQRYWHTLQGSNAKHKLLASHSTARELGVPKGGTGTDVERFGSGVDLWNEQFNNWTTMQLVESNNRLEQENRNEYKKEVLKEWADTCKQIVDTERQLQEWRNVRIDHLRAKGWK